MRNYCPNGGGVGVINRLQYLALPMGVLFRSLHWFSARLGPLGVAHKHHGWLVRSRSKELELPGNHP